jgi:SAM-dependent methyltransferase
MGDINQLDFIRAHRERFTAPILEVGSHDYGSTQNIRSLYADAEYTGIDINPGPGVDRTLDLTRPFDEIDHALGGRRFGTIFCLSVLEHCDQPFVMADNMTRLLAPGGQIYLSVPFAWKFHGYPSDYWRFTHEGVKKLFPGLQFDGELDDLSTPRQGERRALDEDIGLIPFSSRWHRAKGHPLRSLSASFLRLLAKLGFLRWLAGYRYVMVPSMINMIGTKPQ